MRRCRSRPAVVLADASQQADLVVVGARGRGPFTGPLLGPVSQKVAAHAHGTVVVVRAEAPAEMPGPVVVGADAADPPVEALTYAFEEARRRGVGVVVVSAARPLGVAGDESFVVVGSRGHAGLA